MAQSPIGYNPNSSVSAGGGGGTEMGIRATPEDFGAQTSSATGKLASDTTDLALHYATMATEARAEDTISNKFAPAVAKLSGDYQEQRGYNAVAGLDTFKNNLTDLHNQFINNASNPYEKRILNQYMSRHVAQELDGAQRHMNHELTSYEDTSHQAFVNTLSTNAVSNYNNQDIVDDSKNRIYAQIQKHGIDRGMDPQTIQQSQQEAWGKTVYTMVNNAVSLGDASTANKVYAANKSSLPGHQQMEIDKLLHAENMRQNGSNNAQAIIAGLPIPDGVGFSVPKVQAVVAQTAQDSGVNPNHALTVAHIESNFGQNVGSRGDIGQTGKGGDLPEQAANMVTELKKSETIADNALGRKSEPWEQYACYQQGAGGGPALLKAAPRSIKRSH